MEWFRVIIDGYVFNIQAYSSEAALGSAQAIMMNNGEAAAVGDRFQVWHLGVEQDPGDDAAVLLTQFCLDKGSNYNLRVRAKRLLGKMVPLARGKE